MRQEYQEQIQQICKDYFDQDLAVELTRPPEEFGDFSTNIALKLASATNQNPRELAQKLAGVLTNKIRGIQSVEVAGPGFINITLQNTVLFRHACSAHSDLDLLLRGQSIVAEYSDPNPFKVLHAGHLYTSLVGDAIANILQTAGGVVHRVNFGGDVGRHVAMAMWSILQELGGEHPEKLQKIDDNKKLEWVSGHYVAGTRAYAEQADAKEAITKINKQVYEVHASHDQSSLFAKIYWTCRQWSYDGFDNLYKQLGMHPFEKYYPESAVSDLGLETVKAHTGTVYKESDGAVVFHGEPYGLFTQVFINSDGLPTYAGKDVGLIQAKYSDFAYDTSFIITDVAQKDHLAVVMKSVEQYEPELVSKTTHHTHGRIKFADGRKMSSREGNVVTASDVLDATWSASPDSDEQVIIGAIRYSFLKNKIGGDISYDPDNSVSLEGNSGPYIQYALVRARSILAKSTVDAVLEVDDLEPAERTLARAITAFPDVFAEALSSYSPHHICNYLYDLAQTFNRFYEANRVLDNPRSAQRVALVKAYEQVLAEGLRILGMPTPERM